MAQKAGSGRYVELSYAIESVADRRNNAMLWRIDRITGGLRMRVGLWALLGSVLILGACAGRDPEAIQTVQPWDAQASCAQIRAEIEANNIKIKALADEQGLKVAQNVITGVGGLFTFGIAWAGMDFKGAASKDVTALEARLKYLTTIAVERCATPAPPQPRR